MEFEVDDQKLAALLNQRSIPVLYRTGEKGENPNGIQNINGGKLLKLGLMA
ncbi:TPA: hypothetical protein AB5C29_003377 [Vibrio cholerae]